MFLKAFLALICMTQVALASSVTVTFDYPNLGFSSNGLAATGSQSGFSYSSSLAYFSGHNIYLHDDSGILSTAINPTSPSYFTPTSIDVYGYSNLLKTGSGPAPGTIGSSQYNTWATSGAAPSPTLSFQGLRNGRIIANQSVGPQALSTMTFNSQFAGIDSLLLNLSIPSALRYQFGTPGTLSNTVWCSQWCAGFQVDNFTAQTGLIAPVPLPPSALLYLTVLVALGSVIGLRKVKHTHTQV